jgi:aspartate carbamoyltransferase
MRRIVERTGGVELLKGKVMGCLFYEASTRTSSSFISAMERLGGSVISINSKDSSIAKGETLQDTVRTMDQYCDIIVLRHPEKGAAQIAARYSRRPVLNAGDGVGEHPTQALLDLFTIREEMGTINGLTVTMMGDLKHGRTVHSLARLLAMYDINIIFYSPSSLEMPEEVLSELREKNIHYQIASTLEEALRVTDVLYCTRIQAERFATPEDYLRVKGSYRITPETLRHAKEKMIIMHPLPRVDEISVEVDTDDRAAYFRQMQYGLYVRMALVSCVLERI